MLEKAIHRTAQKKTEAAPEQTSRVKMALLIFAYFIKIGSFTFGSGWSILAQMEQEFVDKRRWLTKQELLELVAVGKSLPGIMIANITMLFGYQMAGVLGGVLAVLGIALPAVVVLSLVTLAYDAIKSNYWVWAALQGVQCAVVPIIGGAAISLGKEALKDKASVFICLAALAVCGIGILFSILIVLGMDIYRKHTYTSVILPDAYRITDMKATAHTSYSVNGSNTDYVYIITVKYEIDGTSYTDTLQILQGTHFATELHARYLADNAPEEVLGNLYYSEKDPSHIGRYGDDSLFVE